MVDVPMKSASNHKNHWIQANEAQGYAILGISLVLCNGYFLINSQIKLN